MTGNIITGLNSVLPLDVRTARIAAGGGLAVSLRESPTGAPESPAEYHAAGMEPDGLDSTMPRPAESRADLSRSVPCPSVQTTPVLNSDPT